MKLLYIAPRYTGGIGTSASVAARKLQEYGFDVKLMEVPHIPVKNLKNPSFAVLGAMKALFGSERYDIAHAWNVPSALAMRAAKARKKVLSVHGVYGEQVEVLHSSTVSKAVSLAEPKVLKWADKLTTNSKTVQRIYREKLGIEFEYLPSIFDTSRFSGLPEVKKADKQVAYIGRDSFEKGIDVLRTAEPQVRGRAVYCTNVPWKEAMTTLKASSMLVVPSRVEGVPQVIKEAFYLKVPVVATNVGGIPELVTDGVTGVLVPPNDPARLAGAVNSLVEDKGYAGKLTDAAHEFLIRNHTSDVLLPKYVEFYEKLVAS